MNWYLAKIVFRIICGDGMHTAQFDEQLRLIEAKDENEAFSKATALGKKDEDAFYNHQQKLVQWQFINITELYKISAFIDGAELYSRVQEADNATLYIELLNTKAAQLQFGSTRKLLQLI